MLSTREIAQFRRSVYAAAALRKRSFPWRRTRNPYRVLISELMLQQTQAPRVVPKYREFLRSFPDIGSLAGAELGAVLRAWQGLGYNRRASYLHRAAQEVESRFGGRIPRATADLQTLPGVGPYTARAVAAFAFNQPTVFIETNIRAVYIQRFFPRGKPVSDQELLPLIELTLDRESPRDWYNALMDYGNELKGRDRALTARSAHHVRQSKFRGSNREIRGFILRALSAQPAVSFKALKKGSPAEVERLRGALDALIGEGLVRRVGSARFSLP